MLRMILERAIQMDVYLYFIKVYDKVCYEDLFMQLGNIDLFGKDIIQNSYWEKIVSILIETQK